MDEGERMYRRRVIAGLLLICYLFFGSSVSATTAPAAQRESKATVTVLNPKEYQEQNGIHKPNENNTRNQGNLPKTGSLENSWLLITGIFLVNMVVYWIKKRKRGEKLT